MTEHIEAWPADETLIARGKYASLQRQRRAALKEAEKLIRMAHSKLATSMKTLTDYENVSTGTLREAATHIEHAAGYAADASLIDAQMQALKDEAWGDKQEAE